MTISFSGKPAALSCRAIALATSVDPYSCVLLISTSSFRIARASFWSDAGGTGPDVAPDTADAKLIRSAACQRAIILFTQILAESVKSVRRKLIVFGASYTRNALLIFAP